MANVVEHNKFVFVNAGINSNKCWEVLLFDNDDVEVRYGRIGKGLQSKTHAGAGRKKMNSLIKSKTKPSSHYNGGCYRKIEVLDVGSAGIVSSSSAARKAELKTIAKKEIGTCSITQKLIGFFTDVNAHNIYQATGGRITYDTSAGTFRTPVGIVTKDSIDEARTLLDRMTKFIEASSFGKRFVATLEDFLMLIPQDVGRKFDPKSFCGTMGSIQKQSDILDGLDASVEAVLATPKTKAAKKVAQLFKVKLAVADDAKTISAVERFFRKGIKSMHSSSRFRIKKIYTVDMPIMQSAWDKDGATMPNIMQLWHGTKASNCLSILKNGYVVPPASASHVAGRAFGNGVYFSDSSTKSLNYATNSWGGADERRYFMFLNQVAMGKMYRPTSTFSGGCRKGFDSTYEKGGGVFINSEMIVYRVSQILPTHLCEFA